MKTSERRARFLERQCFARAKHAKSRDDFLQLQVQTCTPFERALVFVAGLVFGGVAVWAYFAEAIVPASIFGAFAAVLIFVGLRGRKRSVDSAFHGLDAAITNGILDALF